MGNIAYTDAEREYLRRYLSEYRDRHLPPRSEAETIAGELNALYHSNKQVRTVYSVYWLWKKLRKEASDQSPDQSSVVSPTAVLRDGRFVIPSNYPPNEQTALKRLVIDRVPLTENVWSWQEGQQIRVVLVGDIHWGSSALNLAHLRADLDWARYMNARILIGGDLFDAIVTKDAKRFSPSVLTNSLAGRDDIINAAIEGVTEFLRPYVDRIDVICEGNHERTLKHWHSLDIMQLLIERLRSEHPGVNIYYGGYTGFVRYEFGKGRNFTIYYHHGVTKSAPVTRGIIEHQRVAGVVEGADVTWLAHTHTQYHSDWVKVSLDGGFREERQVRTGSYLNYSQDHYGVTYGYAPGPHGGAKVFCTFMDNHKRVEVLQ